MKNTFFIITLITLFLCSCNTKQNTKDSQSSELHHIETTTPTDITTTFTEQTISNKTDSSNIETKEEYTYYIDTINCDDIYDCYYTAFPEKINQYSYNIYGIYDEENILVNLEKNINEYNEIGLYNFIKQDYKKLTDIYSTDNIITYNDNYIFIIEYNHFSYNRKNDLNKLKYYDIKNNVIKPIFNYTNNFIYTGHSPVIKNNALYFDVYEDENRKNSYIYKYDMNNNELTELGTDYLKPLKYNGDISFFIKNDQDGYFNIIQSFENPDSESFHIKDSWSSLTAINDKIFALCYIGNGRSAQSELRELVTNKQIFITSNYPSLSMCNEYFVTFEDLCAIHNIPVVYDIEKELIVRFPNLPSGTYRTKIQNDLGMVFTIQTFSDNNTYEQTHKYNACIFKKKQG